MQTRTVSTNGTIAYELQLTLNKYANVLKLEGYYSGGVNAWLQIHDAKATPSNGATPLRSLFLGATQPNGFLWQYDDPPLSLPNSGQAPLTNGLRLCLSTTEATLTLATGTNKADMWASIEEYEMQDFSTETSVGDTTTGINALQVWAEVSGPHVLKRLTMSNTTGTAIYAWVFPDDSEATKPTIIMKIAANTSNVIANFGNNAGVSPYSQDANGTPHQGCTVGFSTSPTVFLAAGATAATCLAAYV